jgi:hypothetical protein
VGGALQTLVGGNITLFTELCERTRADAFALMLEHASERGANACSASTTLTVGDNYIDRRSGLIINIIQSLFLGVCWLLICSSNAC